MEGLKHRDREQLIERELRLPGCENSGGGLSPCVMRAERCTAAKGKLNRGALCLSMLESQRRECEVNGGWEADLSNAVGETNLANNASGSAGLFPEED